MTDVPVGTTGTWLSDLQPGMQVLVERGQPWFWICVDEVMCVVSPGGSVKGVRRCELWLSGSRGLELRVIRPGV